MESDHKTPVFRGRKLKEDQEVWTFNTWDDVEWTKDQAQHAEAVIRLQLDHSPHLDSPDAVHTIIREPAAQNWDRFYNHHDRWFFKDRNWLRGEFPELFDPENKRILEVGCGAGNTIFPLVKERDLEGYEGHVWACDFAPSAVKLVKEFREYNPSKMTVFLHDLATDEHFVDIPEGSLDIIVAIFVFSALDPQRLPFVFSKLFRMLRPGGILLFRDYGKYDMTQLRFKAERLIRPDLYVRGDGTAVHYFETEEISNLAQEAGFQTLCCDVDRRLLVNRFRKLTMYRIWIQAKFLKPSL